MSNIRNTNPVSPRHELKRRGPSLQISKTKPFNTQNSSRRTASVPPTKCTLCVKKIYGNKDHNYFATTMHKSLYTKYASSQNYYYTKDIHELLSDARTPVTIRFKDFQCYDDTDEYLKRFYNSSEYGNKIQLLTEYYKFHWDIPRLFMLPITEVLNRFHDRKRRLQYIRVTKMLKEQKDNKNPSAKPSASLKPKPEEPKDLAILDPILVGLETSQSMLKNGKAVKPKPEEKGTLTRRGSEVKEKIKNNDILIQDDAIGQLKKAEAEKREYTKTQQKRDQAKQGVPVQNAQVKENSMSHTLQDLNIKLGEIISGSEFKMADSNYLDTTDHNLNETLSNLKNFLAFLKINQKPSETSRPLSGINRVSSGPQLTGRPTLIVNTQRGAVKKEAIPKPQQQQQQVPEKNPQANPLEKKASGPNIITWNRTDSVPLLTPVPTDTARKELQANKSPEKSGEPERAPIKLIASGRVSSESLSSTMTSKSKSVYSSITKIRNFDEAIKISNQGPATQKTNKLEVAPTHLGNRLANLQDTNGVKNIQEFVRRDSSPFNTNNLDFSAKAPFNYWDERSKESKESSPTSKQSSHLLSPVIVKGNPKILTTNTTARNKLQTPLPSKSNAVSPQAQTSQLRIDSHRELCISLEKSSNNFISPKQIPQLPLAKGHSHTKLPSATMSKTNSTKNGFIIQTGREIKNFMTLGPLEPQLQLKDARSMPNSARRETGFSGKGDFVGSSLKISEGIPNTDRERESIPISPKVSNTPRKFVYHKHTRSEGKLAKIEAFDPKGGFDPRMKEVLRHGSLNDAGEENCSEVSSKTNKKDTSGKKSISYNPSNIGNLFLSNHKDMYSDKSPMNLTQRRQQMKSPSELLIGGNMATGIRSPKPDVLVKRKNNPMRKSETFGMEHRPKGEANPTVSTVNPTKVKTLSIKTTTGHLTASHFYKPSSQLKGK